MSRFFQFLHRLILTHRLTRLSTHLAATRENLQDAEQFYRDNYPTDRTVEYIVTMRNHIRVLDAQVESLRIRCGDEAVGSTE